MVFGWSKTHYSPIAVDFGVDSLKLLQIIPGEPPQIAAAACAEAPESARQDPAARQAFLGEALRSLLKAQPFKGRRAICSIPAHQMLVQHVQIPKGEEEDFDAQVARHLRERLGVDPSRMVVRAFNIGQFSRDGASRTEAICLAAGREVVMRLIDLAHRARLDVVGMHAEPLAILRAVAHQYRRQDDRERTTCFIDIGAATTKVVIVHGQEMVFAKTIHAAGDHFTRHRAKVDGSSFAQARAARMQDLAGAAAMIATRQRPEEHDIPVGAAVGVRELAAPQSGGGLAVIEAQMAAERTASRGAAASSPTERTQPPPSGASTSVPRGTGPNAPAPAAKEDLGDTLDCLVDELQLCVRYHQSTFTGRPIERLVFLGGEAHHLDTCQTIARSLRIAAQLGDPLARLTRASQSPAASGVDFRRPQPGWAVPLGLCLSEANL